MQKGSWGGGGTASGRGRGGGGRGAAGPRYTPAATTTGTLDQFVTTSTKSTRPPMNRPTARSPSRPTTAAAKASPAGAEAQPEPTVEEDLYSSTTDEVATGEVIFTVGYGGLKSTDAFVERLKVNGITRLLDIRISPHCGFNKDFTGRAMGVLLRKQGIAYEHFMELGNVWRSEGSEPELDAAIRLRLYRELMTTAGELLTRRLRQRVQAAPHERICILCACGDVRECHRNIVATYLHEAHHYNIRHI